MYASCITLCVHILVNVYEIIMYMRSLIMKFSTLRCYDTNAYVDQLQEILLDNIYVLIKNYKE